MKNLQETHLSVCLSVYLLTFCLKCLPLWGSVANSNRTLILPDVLNVITKVPGSLCSSQACASISTAPRSTCLIRTCSVFPFVFFIRAQLCPHGHVSETRVEIPHQWEGLRDTDKHGKGHDFLSLSQGHGHVTYCIALEWSVNKMSAIISPPEKPHLKAGDWRSSRVYEEPLTTHTSYWEKQYWDKWKMVLGSPS